MDTIEENVLDSTLSEPEGPGGFSFSLNIPSIGSIAYNQGTKPKIGVLVGYVSLISVRVQVRVHQPPPGEPADHVPHLVDRVLDRLVVAADDANRPIPPNRSQIPSHAGHLGALQQRPAPPAARVHDPGPCPREVHPKGGLMLKPSTCPENRDRYTPIHAVHRFPYACPTSHCSLGASRSTMHRRTQRILKVFIEAAKIAKTPRRHETRHISPGIV